MAIRSSGFNYLLIVFMLDYTTFMVLLRWDAGKFRDRFVVWVGLSVG